MPSYWWECEECEHEYGFNEVTKSKGIVTFIWDELLPSNWNQDLLLKRCPNCNNDHLRLAYLFPRSDTLRLRVIHIVGLDIREQKYLPMMWETYFTHNPTENVFDFKYMNGRNNRGLNKPAVLSKNNLSQIFSLYNERTGNISFP